MLVGWVAGWRGMRTITQIFSQEPPSPSCNVADVGPFFRTPEKVKLHKPCRYDIIDPQVEVLWRADVPLDP